MRLCVPAGVRGVPLLLLLLSNHLLERLRRLLGLLLLLLGRGRRRRRAVRAQGVRNRLADARAHLVGVSLALAPGKACYIPLAHRPPGGDGELDLEGGARLGEASGGAGGGAA